MAINLQYSFPDVPLSITNPYVQYSNAIDTEGPLPFLKFIKTVTGTYEPEGLQAYYTHYLQVWNETKNNSAADSRQIIVDRYVEFLKDISIDYTTQSEKKFLENIDFQDPLDLEVAVSFYARKIRDIALYYSKKRDDAKFELTRKKLKGSNLGATRKIRELSLDYLSNRQLNKLEFDIEQIKSSLEIEIDELFDVTSTYFNQTPTTRYDFQTRDYDRDIFLLDDASIIDDIFAGVSQELRTLREASDLIENKRSQTKKFIGSDFYYLSTGPIVDSVVQFVTGAAFTADDPIRNLQNRDYPTLATIDRGNLQTKRDVGYFRPNKFSIVCIDTKSNSYSVNTAALKENTIYYFPDPELYGSAVDALTFIVDDTKFRNNISTGNAQGQPITGPGDTSYYGYASLIPPSPYLDHDLNAIFDNGYVHDQKRDIYGNTYGLVKPSNFQQNVNAVSTNVIKDLQLNGHTFYDTEFNEGFNFDYTTPLSAGDTETIRSGIQSYTNSFTTASLSAYYLSFRYFQPYEELILPRLSNTTFSVRDGAYFSFSLNERLPDPKSSDLSAYPGTDLFYYNSLYEGGINSVEPLQRALFDAAAPTLSANFTANIGLSANPQVVQVDCGLFSTSFDLTVTLNQQSPAYIDTTTNETMFSVVSSIVDPLHIRSQLAGNVFIKNVATNTVETLSDTLYYLESKYAPTVYNQLSSIVAFDLIYDTMFIQTPNYLVIDKVNYVDTRFVSPATFNNVITYNVNKFNKLSNRFKVGDNIFFYTLQLLDNSLSATPSAIVYPEIYKFSYSLHTSEKIFPKSQSQLIALSALFTSNTGNVLYIESASPVLTHNSTNNLFNISYLLKDNNQLPSLYTFDFDYATADVVFLSGSNYAFASDNQTFIPTSSSSLSSFSFALSSSAINVSSGELTL